MNQWGSPSWSLQAIGFSLPALIYTGLVVPCPQTAAHILSHLLYFEFLKGRRNYALFALIYIFCIAECSALVNE
jgi:hypothetical protein